MLRILLSILLTMLMAGSVIAQQALNEGHQFPWSQHLSECMAAGGQRSECYESMPPDILAALEAWEAERGVIRRRQIESRPQLENTARFGMEVAGGSLKVHSFSAPMVVDENRLRNLTNVDRSTPLVMQDWGNFSGYQYDYSEDGSFYRQWWLVKQRTMMFVVYESSVEIEDTDSDEIDRIVRSLTVNGS